MTTPSDVLRQAAQVLQRDGWYQGALHSKDGRHCMVGATWVAAQELGVFNTRTAGEAVTFLHRHLPADYLGPGTWNDQPDRQQAEVEKFLLQVADAEDAS